MASTPAPPQPALPPGALRVAGRIAAAGAVLLPVVTVARMATWTSAVGSFFAGSSIPVLLLLVAAGHAAATVLPALGARRLAAVAAFGAGVLVAAAAAFAVAADTPSPDATGHGLFAPTDRPVWLVVPMAAIALASGWFLVPLVRRLPWLRRAADEPAPARRPATALPPIAALGALGGLVAFTPGCAALLARQTPERTVVVDGVTRVMGPVLPLVLWTGLLAASLGVVLAVAGTGIVAAATRRLRAAHLQAAFGQVTLALLSAGFVLRVVALLTVNDARRDGGDPFFYHVTANLLGHSRGFWEPLTWVNGGTELASALHGPAFPAALSFFSRIGGTGYFDHQMASIVLGVPQVVAVVVLANLLFGRRAAVVAGALAVVYPNIWVTDGTLFVEGLMAVFTTLATWCAYRYRATPGRQWTVWLGALVGLAALTRGEALLLIVLLLVPIVLRTPFVDARTRWRHLGWGIGAFVLTLAPWMLYNTPRFNVFVPLSTNSNEVLFYANCDDVYAGHAIGFWSFACQERYREQYGEAPGDQAEQSVFWRGKAIDYMKDHASELPKVIVARVGRQWELFRPSQTLDFAFIEGRPRGAVELGQDMYYVMMALSIPATLALRRRGVPSWPLWVHAIAVTLTAAYAYGTLRFRAPFEPILCVFAAIGGVWLFDLARARLVARREGSDVALAQ